MRFLDLSRFLEELAPTYLAESYDNPGLLTGHPDQEISGVLINLDVTDELLDEALDLGANLIITHHPIWFSPRKRLNGEDYVSRILIKAIKNDLGLYAIHTNLDNIQEGVNAKISEKLGLDSTSFLLPKNIEKEKQLTGSGMIGYLPSAMQKTDFLDLLTSVFQANGIRYADTHKTSIQKVAVCGGSGSFLIREALMKKADAFVTADITYHKFFDNEGEMLLVDIGHYESEQFTSQLLHKWISEKFSNFAVHLSKINTNPVHYF